jgi:UDP-2,4-diacetamido-2,4,6-trideoxy-beta-L-altropyranose hydrolase
LVHHRLPDGGLRGPVRYFEGPQFGILRPEFERLRATGRPQHDGPSRVLVSFGGADPRRNTVTVLRALIDARIPDIDVQVVIGPRFVGRDEVRELAARAPFGVTVHEDLADGIAELMARCDFGLVGAGTTILEMAALGVPALIVGQSPEEMNFGRTFERRGAARVLGVGGAVDPSSIASQVRDIATDPALRDGMSAAARAMVDGRGRLRIAALIGDALRARPVPTGT